MRLNETEMKLVMTEANSVLRQPIEQLMLSHSFKEMAKVNGFVTLQDIFDTSLHDLPFRPLSGYRILKELIDVAAEYELLLEEEF